MSFMTDIVPWLLSAFGITGFIFVQNGQKVFGWGICLTGQIAWTIYAISTKQWGFLASVPLYATVYTRGIRKAITE
jgi:hypothetical protein